MIDLDIARRNELPETFTSQDIEDIKAEIDIPRANVTILNTVYSPEETKVGVWREYRTVEGQQVLMDKPVYQKTYHGTITSMGGVYRCNWDIGTDIEKWMVLGGTITTESNTSGGISAIGGHQGNPSTETSTAYVWFASSSFDVIQANHYGLSVFSKIADSNNKSCFVNLQYTLTTDQWQEVVE